MGESCAEKENCNSPSDVRECIATEPIYERLFQTGYHRKKDPWSLPASQHPLVDKPPYAEMQNMTLDLVRDLCLYVRKGDNVLTPFGLGTLQSSSVPKEGESMVIKLVFGGYLYARLSDSIHKVLSTKDYQKAIKYLNEVRELHVASVCHSLKRETPKEGKCVACSLDRPEFRKEKGKRRQRWMLPTSSRGSRAPRLATHECDVCGVCVCSQHRVDVAVEYFTICVDCSHDLDQTEHQLNPHHPDLKDNLQRLLYYYTRMSIRLAFACPHIPKIASRLTTEQHRDSKISLGTSGLGFVGAALGVAGAAALVTPAGPALLLAAVATSATSGTIQATHISYSKFLSNKDAHQIADRVLGWHGLCLGILRTLEQLRKDLLAESALAGSKEYSRFKTAEYSKQGGVDIWNALAVGSFATTRQAMTGVGVSASLGASYSQALSTGLQTIPVVGAAFSVGCMAFDASSIYGSMQTLLKPSEKAVALQHVEQLFVHSIPNLGYVQSTVQLVVGAVEMLQQRWEEQRREQEEEYQSRTLNAFEAADSLFAPIEDDIQSVG